MNRLPSLIAQLKQGTAPWQKPWQPGDPLLSFPHNPNHKETLRGINALYLMSQDYADPRWLTHKQAAGFGCTGTQPKEHPDSILEACR